MPLVINGNSYRFKPFAQPEIVPAIDWLLDSAKRMNGRDFGAGQDKYFSELTFEDTKDTIDSLQADLDLDGRGTITVNGLDPGQEIFGPEVDYAEDIEATLDPKGKRKYVTLGKMSALSVRLRARTPALLGTTASLATLRLQEGWEADSELDLPTAWTYSQGVTRLDRKVKGGGFVGRFVQTTTEARAILAYLLTTARVATVPFPSLDVDFPFGYVSGNGSHNCKIPKWEIARRDLSTWEFKITFTPELWF